MWQHLLSRFWLSRFGALLDKAIAFVRPRLRRATVAATAFARGPLRSVLKAVLQTVAALLVLFLEWGWRPLADALGRLSKYLVFARLEAWIAGLPPYGALAMFAAPAICLLPLKLVALYLFASGHPAVGVALILAAKVVGTAVVARIFILTQPQLMSITWFRRAYDVFMPWKERMFAEIRASAAWRTGRAIRVDVKRWINRTWIALKPQRRWASDQIANARLTIAGFLSGLLRSLR